MPAQLGEDFVEVGVQDFGVAGLERQPRVLDLSPARLDAVEFAAVGRQDAQGQPFLFEPLQHGLDRLG